MARAPPRREPLLAIGEGGARRGGLALRLAESLARAVEVDAERVLDSSRPRSFDERLERSDSQFVAFSARLRLRRLQRLRGGALAQVRVRSAASLAAMLAASAAFSPLHDCSAADNFAFSATSRSIVITRC